MQNIILTGIPRSGTSLICQLLNQCTDTIAVSEPPIQVMDNPSSVSHIEIVEGISHYFQETRQTLLTEKSVISRHLNGEIPDNYFEPYHKELGIRQSNVGVGTVLIDKPLRPDFTLCVKHPAPFTALLATLINTFPCYAIIRNPLAVLASWNSVNVPIGVTGHVPAAERLDITLSKNLAHINEKKDRQLFLLNWFFQQYKNLLPKDHILSYEKVVSQPNTQLSVITSRAKFIKTPLENRNKTYDKALLAPLAERLLNSEGVYWDFYSKDDVADILLKCH